MPSLRLRGLKIPRSRKFRDEDPQGYSRDLSAHVRRVYQCQSITGLLICYTGVTKHQPRINRPMRGSDPGVRTSLCDYLAFQTQINFRTCQAKRLLAKPCIGAPYFSGPHQRRWGMVGSECWHSNKACLSTLEPGAAIQVAGVVVLQLISPFSRGMRLPSQV